MTNNISKGTKTISPIGYIKTNFSQKFGIPRQSGLINNHSVIQLIPPFNEREAVKGLEGFSHLWIVWDFSEAKTGEFSPTVRPPRLGGEKHMGVFATRSPFRPNGLGLSCVKLDKVEFGEGGTILIHILGADLLDGTPVYDIKPYLAYADSYPDATLGWTSDTCEHRLAVNTDAITGSVSSDMLSIITELIAQDPRSHKISPKDKLYHLAFGDYDVSFTVEDNTATIHEISM